MNSEEPLRTLCIKVWSVFADSTDLDCIVRPSMPVLYFGDLERYWSSPARVVTAALNPSRHEFPAADPFVRFPTMRAVEGRTDDERYLEALNNYFRVEPYRRWFCSSFEPVLNGMNASYFD